MPTRVLHRLIDSAHAWRRAHSLLGLALAFLCLAAAPAPAAEAPRAVIAQALVTEDAEEQAKLVTSLAGSTDPLIQSLLIQWKEGGIFLFEAPADLPGFTEGQKVAVTLSADKDAEDKQGALRVDTTEPLKDAAGKPLRLLASDLNSAETDSNLRTAMKGVLDIFALAAPDPAARLRVITQMGLDQDPALLDALLGREKVEGEKRVKRALREAICQVQLKSEEPAVQVAAIGELAALGSISSQDFLKELIKANSPQPAAEGEAVEALPEGAATVLAAAKKALSAIETHTRWTNFYGTLFRGLSLGSILLVVAIGLAITFGLMGVINMAHGELIAIGAYTTYIVQGIFAAGVDIQIPLFFFNSIGVHIPGANLQGGYLDAYFLVALPLSFLAAAAAGIILERGVIRFLYKRPLESLLATWGVSLVLQQMFRLIFGANNVQVYSPSWLSSNWTVFDVILGWNRLFVIGFAMLIIVGTWAILNKTPLGLLIRAVMQNRAMAACMGVPTQRVNMLTFGFGSGLAGLAGAFLSQIGNVGPALGQDYIVSAFMTVVVGGVGSLAGTVISALGIGVIDQSLQQILLNPVIGKICVLVGIILFLQWRPAGIFVTKSRSLEG